MRHFKKVNRCRICNLGRLKKYLNLEEQPLANSFLKQEDIKNEKNIPWNFYFVKNVNYLSFL